MKEPIITRRSLSERRKSKTNWEAVDRLTDDEINKLAASDPDAAPILTDEWFARAELVAPKKRPITIRVDADVLEYFQQSGSRYQTRINQVLRAYVEAKKKEPIKA